jgi:hypothetical protein
MQFILLVAIILALGQCRRTRLGRIPRLSIAISAGQFNNSSKCIAGAASLSQVVEIHNRACWSEMATCVNHASVVQLPQPIRDPQLLLAEHKY